MKRFALLFLALSLLSIPALADDVQPVDKQVAAIVASGVSPAAKAASLMPLLNAAGATNEAQKAEFAKMAPKKDAIELAASALNKYLPAHNDAVRALEMDFRDQNNQAARNQAAQDAHNANRCMYPPDNPGACAGYNAEAASLNAEAGRIDAWGKQLNQKASDLNAEKAKLDEIQKNLSDDVVAYTAWSKQYNANVAQNQANIRLLVSALKQVLKSNDDCKKAIASGTDENMSEICGQLFDGNAIHSGDTNKGTGTKSFGTGSNPTNEQEPHN